MSGGMSGAGEVEDRLYGLLEVGERQQAAAQAALEGMPQRRLMVSSTPSTTSPAGRKAPSTCTRSVRATARPSQRARFSTSW